MQFSTSSDESSLLLPPPKKRWSGLSRTVVVTPVKKAQTPRRVSRTPSWKLRDSQDDPVNAPTESEVEVARTLIKLTGKRTRRRRCRNYLRIARPVGMPPLYGNFKDIELNRKSSRLRTSVQSSPKTQELDCWEKTSNPGTSLLNGPCSGLPSLSPPDSSGGFDEGPFNKDLNNLHAAVGKLREVMRTGEVLPGVLNGIMTKIPPAVFEPEFHQEIEQVRSKQKQQLTIDPTISLFTNKSSNEI